MWTCLLQPQTHFVLPVHSLYNRARLRMTKTTTHFAPFWCNKHVVVTLCWGRKLKGSEGSLLRGVGITEALVTAMRNTDGIGLCQVTSHSRESKCIVGVAAICKVSDVCLFLIKFFSDIQRDITYCIYKNKNE